MAQADRVLVDYLRASPRDLNPAREEGRRGIVARQALLRELGAAP
jgi:hypothetical protein